MKVTQLRAARYRSLREAAIRLADLNLFIGTNASGKSSILDALRFLHEGILSRDFQEPVANRGHLVHLAWKGEEARQIELTVAFSTDNGDLEWTVRLLRSGYGFTVQEEVRQIESGRPPSILLTSDAGNGWWWSGEKQVPLKQSATSCALAAASADASFPARGVAEFVNGWGFFDPNPYLLRRGWSGLESTTLDAHGRNLAERLYALSKSSPETFARIVTATQGILGLPTQIEPRVSDDGRFFFAQGEPGLHFPVLQVGASSGTLRMLALMTALFGEAATGLVGIEEPENHVHPTALAAFAEHLLRAREFVQILVTTHSPLLLDYLNEPNAVCVVRRDQLGTHVVRESNPDGVRQALEQSGFGLGEFYETKGFGG